MKRTFAMILVALGLMTTSSVAQTTAIGEYENVVYMDNVKATANSEIEVSVNMNNAVDVTGFEFNISLPDGITIPQEDGDYLIELSTERTTFKNHNIFDAVLKEDGTIYVLCNSTKSKTFSGTSGEVATITMNVGAVKSGTYYVTLKNVIITRSDATSLKVGDIVSAIAVGDNGSVKLNASGLATFSSVFEYSVPAGVTAYTGIVDEDAKTVTWTEIMDGVIPANEGVLLKGDANATVTLATSSTGKAKIEGNDLKANLSARAKSAIGVYVYVLSGESILRLSDSGTLAANKAYFSLNKYVTSASAGAKSFTFVWEDATGIDAVKTSDNKPAYNINGVSVKSNSKGVVIVDGKKQYNK